MVSVTLGVPDGAKSLTSVIQDYENGGSGKSQRIGLRPSDVQALLAALRCWRSGAMTCPCLSRTADGAGRHIIVVLPLSYQRQLSGIIALGERFDLVPTEEDREQMRRLADQAAVALANARMLEQVRELAYYDSLTGLPEPALLQGAAGLRPGAGQPEPAPGGGVLHRPRSFQPDQRHAGP